MATGNFKIRIFQPLVRAYRIALHDGLAAHYGDRIELWAADVPGASVPLKRMRYDYNHPMLRFGPFAWQRGLNLKGLSKGDVVIINGDLHQLSSLLIAIEARLKGIGVVWWGLHKMPNQNKFFLAVRKRVMMRLASTILFYNKSGIEWLKSEGYDTSHVFATGNTIDQASIKAALAEWTEERLAEFQRKEGLIGHRVVLTCSRIIEKQRLHEAIEALSKKPLAREGTLLVVIGDGPLKDDCQRLAERLGVSSRIRWLGAIFDERDMAPWFLSAKAFTYPGPVGLAILKALSYGLPAVLNDTHNSTEAEIMENGKTGLLFKEHDTEDLARTLDELMSDEGRREKMSEYSRKVAFENYSMDMMINNFSAAIEDAASQAASQVKGASE